MLNLKGELSSSPLFISDSRPLRGRFSIEQLELVLDLRYRVVGSRDEEAVPIPGPIPGTVYSIDINPTPAVLAPWHALQES